MRINPFIFLFTLLLILISMPVKVFSGNIIGMIDQMSSTSTKKLPQSPFARSRSPEGFLPHTETNDSSLIAVVYLEKHKLLPPELKIGARPVVDQVDMEIIPHILPIQVGTLVKFMNSDDVYHNIFSLSPPRKFDLGRYGKGGQKNIVFKKTGEVKVFCDIHPHMNSVILVLPNNYFSSVYSDGKFIIRDVPKGKYKIHAWHEKYPESVREISVPANGDVEIIMILGER